jgi:hypothetical protein
MQALQSRKVVLCFRRHGERPTSGFDVPKIVANALSNNASIAEALLAVENSLVPKIGGELVGLDDRDPEGKNPGSEPRSITVMIITIENGNPVSADIKFHLTFRRREVANT